MKYKEQVVLVFVILFLSIRYYPHDLLRTTLETLKFLLALGLYSVGFGFLFKWFVNKFLKRDLAREAMVKVILWAATIMALGESLKTYFGPK